MTDPYAAITTRATPQKVQADPRQHQNHAGGYSFTPTDVERLRRFLVLGTTGGTYYQGERELTLENATLVLDMIRNGHARTVVDEVTTLSVTGRAPKQNPLLFALAAATNAPLPADRRYALEHLARVARTSTHLFTFTRYLRQFRGWGPLVREHVGAWYLDKPADRLGYQVAKYREREGWTHRDILRLAHPHAAGGTDPAHRAIFDWLCGRDPSTPLPQVITDFEAAQATTDPAEWVAIIRRGTLSWEMLPDAALTNAEVWQALLESDNVPVGALIRQLPRLSRIEVPGGTLANSRVWGDMIVGRLTDAENLRRGRIHPINVLVAMRTYASGKGTSSVWQPARKIVDALDQAYYLSFGTVEPTGGSVLCAVDTSSSMTSHGLFGRGNERGPINAREGAAAMAMATARVESDYEVVGFTAYDQCQALAVSPRQRIDDVIHTIARQPNGGTDCALPIQWALRNNRVFDTIIIYTDSETWAGGQHVHQALTRYRQAVGKNTRLVVVAMASNDCTIADPSDPGSLNVAGFDSAVPRLISDFARGDV